MQIALATLALLLFAGMAQADTVWHYQGNSTSDPAVGHIDDNLKMFVPTPNPCGCAISGSLTLSDANVPVLWSFTAGAINLTNLNSTIEFNDLAQPGNPVPFYAWDLSVSGAGALLFSGFEGSHFDATDDVLINGQTYQYVRGDKGVWTESVATPEPGTLALIGVGLVGLIAGKRSQVRRNQVPEAVWEPLA